MTFDAGSVESQLTLDRDPFQVGLKQAQKEAADFQRKNGIKITADIDDDRFNRKLSALERQAVAANRRNIKVSADMADQEFNRKYAGVKAKVDAASASRITVAFDLNDRLAATKFGLWRARVKELSGQTVNIDVDVKTAGASAKLAAFRTLLGTIGQRSGLNFVGRLSSTVVRGAASMVASGAQAGFRFGTQFVMQMGGVLSGVGEYIMPILIGSLVGVMPAIGALAGGALVSGFAFGIAGLGILMQARTKQMKAEFKATFSGIASELRTLTQPFQPFLMTLNRVIRSTFEAFAPFIGSASNIIAPALSDFIKYLGSALARLAPILPSIANAFSQMTAAFGPQLPHIFQMIANALNQMALIIQRNPQFFAGMLASIIKLIPYAIGFINTLMNIALWINRNATLVKILGAVLLSPITAFISWGRRIPSILRTIGGAFSWFGGFVKRIWGAVWGFIRGQAVGQINSIKAVVNGGMHGISAAFSWISKTARAIWRAIWSFLKGQTVGQLNSIRAVVNGAFHGISAAFSWMGRTARSIWNAMWNWVRNTARTVLNTTRNITNSAFHGIGNAFSWMGRTARNIWGSMFNWLRDRAHSMLNSIRSVINDALHGFRNAFAWARDAIGAVWSAIQRTVAKPVNFVIDTVYNQHLRVWANRIASAVGLGGKKGWLPAASKVPGYAGGGILPGQSQYSDGDSLLVPMRPGEGVYVSEAMQDPYERARLAAVNRAALRGQSLGRFQGIGAFGTAGPISDGFSQGGVVRGYAGGGIIDTGLGWLSSAYQKVKNFGSKVLHGGKDLAEQVMAKSVNWLYDHGPKQAINGMLRPLAASSPYGNVISKIPDTLIKKILAKLTMAASAMGGGNGQAADVIRTANKYIGTKEHPMGSNRQIFGQRFGMNGVPWCAEFITEVFKEAHAGGAIPHSAAVAAFNGSHLARRRGKPVPGDLFTYGNSHINLYTGPGRRTVGGNQGNMVSADTSHFGRRTTTLIPKYAKGNPGGGINLGGKNGYFTYAKDFMRQMGMSVGYNWPSLYRLWMGESGWNPHIRNKSSGAGGIPQALPPSKMGPGWYNHPAQQIAWGLRYIKSRYGNPYNAYHTWLRRSPHWYDSGGDLSPGGTVAWNGTGKVESVITADWREAVETKLNDIAAVTGRAPLVGSYHTNFYGTGDMNEAMRDLNYELRRLNAEVR